MKIIVGVDGSAAARRAVEWCAAHAAGLEAEVIAVFSIETPVYAPDPFGYVPMPMPAAPDREQLLNMIATDWCAPLAGAKTAFRVVVAEGAPAATIIAVADKESADLVCVGRRGRGGFAELLLGSTSHALSHHLDRPLVIVP